MQAFLALHVLDIIKSDTNVVRENTYLLLKFKSSLKSVLLLKFHFDLVPSAKKEKRHDC